MPCQIILTMSDDMSLEMAQQIAAGLQEGMVTVERAEAKPCSVEDFAPEYKQPIQDGDLVQPMEFGSQGSESPPFVVRYQELSPEGRWKLYGRDQGDPDFDAGDYWLDCDVVVVEKGHSAAIRQEGKDR